jgi:environmental stress-induced protein Ves
MNLRVISQESYKRAAWKNGLGVTSEIAIHPENASLKEGNFLWRLSSARVEKASPFSEFPFHDRALVILEGAGIRLFHTFEPGEPPELVELPPLEPYEFPGDVPSRCELTNGPITDLSVFIRKAEAEALTEVLRVEPGESRDWHPEGRWNFLFVARGEILLEPPGEAPVEVRERDTALLELTAPLPEGHTLSFTSPQGATVVQITLSG